MASLNQRPRVALLWLALAAVVAYLPLWRQPLLEDDYPNLLQAATYGVPAAWRVLAHSVFLQRATSEWLMWAAYRMFGLHAAGYYAIGIALHIVDTWLVFALGKASRMAAPFAAALFFAVYDGHQEAIMWFSACNELLLFLFGVAALLCWMRFLAGGSRWWYAGTLGLYALALLSKESAPVFAALFLLPLATLPRRRAPFLAPLIAMASASAWLTYAGRDNSFRFQDGSFSLRAPFWAILPRNMMHLFWFWGVAALIAVAFLAWKLLRGQVAWGVAWVVLALAPYSFLTYSARIPSRQFYLASAGMALVVAAGWVAAEDRLRTRRSLAVLLCAAVLLENTGYLWIRKRAQFLARAEPTEELIALARRSTLPIYIQCFPRNHFIAESAVRLGAGRAEGTVFWDAAEAHAHGAFLTFCYAPNDSRIIK